MTAAMTAAIIVAMIGLTSWAIVTSPFNESERP